MKNLIIYILLLMSIMIPVAAVSGPSQAKVLQPAATVLSGPPGQNSKPIKVVCTAYDLSICSCGKPLSHPAYGITASGVSLRGKTREQARAIATDPKVIPMGTEVLLVFRDPKRQKYSGYYTAVDTGGAIRGNRIDIFFGDTGETVSGEAVEFGVSSAELYM